MNNKSNNMENSKGSFANFLKKESFYVILFICLCIVAAVAALTINSKNMDTAKVQNANKTAMENQSKKQDPNNALFVKNEKENNKVEKDENIKVRKSGKTLKEASESVANNVKVQFAKPVEGKLIQGYSEIPVLASEDSNGNSKTYKTNLGINIQSKVGTPVKAAADGVVEEIGENPKGYGYMVVINHQNGYKTVYSNLDQKVLIKKGDKVTQGQEVAKIGNTTLRVSNNKSEGSYLHFSMLEGNESFKKLDYENKYIDPCKFIK